MPESQTILSSFISSSLSTKLNILSLTLVFSASAIMSVPLAILFKEPVLICIDPSNDIKFQCPEFMACSNEYIYYVDKENGPLSLSAQFELICEASAGTRFALTCLFIGLFIAAALQTFIFVESRKRKSWLFLTGLGFSIVLALMLMVDILKLSFDLMPWLLLLGGILFLYPITYTYIYVSENLSGELASFTMLFMIVGWGLVGIIYAVLGYAFNADWRVLIGIACILLLLGSFIFFFSKPQPTRSALHDELISPTSQQLSTEPMGIWSLFKDMWPNITIRTNFLVYILLWSFYCMVYNVLYVEMESVGGSVYFNIMLCCVLEIISAFVASVLTKKYECDQVLKTLVSIAGVIMGLFIAAPVSISEASGYLVTILVFCLLITKLCNDLITLMIYLILPKMFTEKYVGFFLIVSRSLSHVFTVFLPSISYLSRFLGVHPFVFYGICYLIIRLMLTRCKKVQKDGVETLFNEVRAGIVERMAILSSAHHSMASSIVQDQIVQKIRLSGIHWSPLFKYKQTSESVMLESLTFSSPLVIESPFQKSRILSP